jgi:hypothetical protein
MVLASRKISKIELIYILIEDKEVILVHFVLI